MLAVELVQALVGCGSALLHGCALETSHVRGLELRQSASEGWMRIADVGKVNDPPQAPD